MKLELKYIIAYKLVDFLSKTWKIETNLIPQKNSVIAFWHGKMLPVWKYFSRYNSTAVVSMSKDGEVLAKLLTKWKFNLIRGSSSKGSKEVLETMMLDNSEFLLVTPDGPRGPINKFKAGAVITAQRTGKPLYLCGCKINKKKIFPKSWDNFELPLLFSHIILNFSEPMFFSVDLNREEINQMIILCENRLNELNNI